jgi:hypothetical protein
MARGGDQKAATRLGATRPGATDFISLGRFTIKRKSKNPKLSDAKIAQLIKGEYKEFKNDDVEQIRQRLRAAHKQYQDWRIDKMTEYSLEPPDDWEEPEPDYDYDD